VLLQNFTKRKKFCHLFFTKKKKLKNLRAKIQTPLTFLGFKIQLAR